MSSPAAAVEALREDLRSIVGSSTSPTAGRRLIDEFAAAVRAQIIEDVEQRYRAAFDAFVAAAAAEDASDDEHRPAARQERRHAFTVADTWAAALLVVRGENAEVPD